MVKDAAGDLEAALHPARERLHERRGAVGKLHHAEQLGDALATHRARYAVDPSVQLEVLECGQLIVERRILEDQADQRTDGPGSFAAAGIDAARTEPPR